MQQANSLNRLNRLPISRFHKITLLAVSFAYFFEFADINSFATTAPKLIRLWGITVDQIAYVTSLSFVGMFVGAIVAGSLSDRWGRKRALLWTTLFFGVFSFAAAFSWDLVSLGVFRVLTSAGLSAMTVVGVVYINEMYPSAIRGKYQATPSSSASAARPSPTSSPARSYRSPTGRGGWSTSGAPWASCSSCSPGTSRSHPAGWRAGANTPRRTRC